MKDYKRLTEKTKLGTYIIGDDSPIIQRLGELEDLIENKTFLVMPKGRSNGKNLARASVIKALAEWKEYEQKIMKQELVGLNDIANFLNRWWGCPCDFIFDGEDVFEYMNEKYGDWCSKRCDKMLEDNTACWEMYLKAKLDDL